MKPSPENSETGPSTNVPSQPSKRKSSMRRVIFAVLAVLVALLVFFVYSAFRLAENQAKKLQTSMDMMALQTGITDFYNEYGELPMPGLPTMLTEGAQGKALLAILLGKEPADASRRNPKGIDFLDLPGRRAGVKEGLVHSNARSGAVPEALYDAWGNPFHVVFDHDSNNQIADPLVPGNVIRNKPVIVYSLGMDGKQGGGKDMIAW